MAASRISFPETEATPSIAYAAGDIAVVLWRNRFLIGSCTVLLSLVGFGLYVMQARTYPSTARVLVQTDQIGAPSFLSGISAYREAQVAETAGRKLETEMALIVNRRNAREVIDALDIRPSQLVFAPMVRITERVDEAMRQWRGRPAPQEETAESALIETFLKNLSVAPVISLTAETTSNVLEIGLVTSDPNLSARALEGVLDAYLTFGARQSRRAGDAATEILQGQVDQAQQELHRLERAIVDLAVAQSERATLAAASVSVTADPRSGGASSAGTGASAAIQLANQVIALEAQVDELRQTFTDKTPSVQRLRRRLSEARARLAVYVRASARQSAEFARLEQQRAPAQERYAELRRKLDQIRLYSELAPTGHEGRLVVVPPNELSLQEGVKSPLFALAGPVAGVLLGLLLAALREFLFPRLHGARDVERWLGVPLVGALPPWGAGDAQASTAVKEVPAA